MSVCHHRYDTEDTTTNISVFLFSWLISLDELTHTFISTVSSTIRGKSFIS